MKPHEYLRMVFSFRGMSADKCQEKLIALPADERREMSLCMLEFMRFMIDLDAQMAGIADEIKENMDGKSAENAVDEIDEQLRNLFRKHDL